MAFDWSTLLSGGLSVATGGVFGLLGVVATKLSEAWERKQQLDILREQNTHALAMRDKDREHLKLEIEGKVRVATTEAEAAMNVSADNAFAKSFDTEPKRYAEGMTAPKGGSMAKFTAGLGWFMMVALDFVRGAIRPGFAIYLAWIVTSMYETQRAAIALLGAEDGDAMKAIYVEIVRTMLFLFTTCVLWYYGIRNRQTPPTTR